MDRQEIAKQIALMHEIAYAYDTATMFFGMTRNHFIRLTYEAIKALREGTKGDVNDQVLPEEEDQGVGGGTNERKTGR